MNVYKILSKGSEQDVICSIPEFTVKYVSIRNQTDHTRLFIDKDYMFCNHGFNISKYECDSFSTHLEIWQEFKRSGDEYCLVMEEKTEFNTSCVEAWRDINMLLRKDGDWDVFFPYDPTKAKEEISFEPGYRLGYHWGTDAYFINQKGADILLRISNIKQPLDEELLEQSINDNLNICYEETRLIDRSENLLLHLKHRKNSIREAIFGTGAWTSKTLIKVRVLLLQISSIAKRAGIDLILSDGSLLGQVRHGGIMPWDDDIDLAMNEDECANLISHLGDSMDLSFSMLYWEGPETKYYKIWMNTGEDIEGHSHKFPFVDIWLYKELDERVEFNHGVSYPLEIYKPFKMVLFEGTNFMLPSDPQSCLGVIYPNWKSEIQVFPWCHRLESRAFFSLTLEISVDESGRMPSAE
jgi:GR25 family glycosyltransferase involved in LPS biosynthesis